MERTALFLVITAAALFWILVLFAQGPSIMYWVLTGKVLP